MDNSGGKTNQLAQRCKDNGDLYFENAKDIKFLNDDVKGFYDDIKSQLRILFWINVVFCVVAAVLVLVGIVMCLFFDKISEGTILTISGIVSELLGNLFINQYRTALNKVSEEYYRLLLCHNMNEALNFAKNLPLTDMCNFELRYHEVREILRAIMKNFDQHIAGK